MHSLIDGSGKKAIDVQTIANKLNSFHKFTSGEESVVEVFRSIVEKAGDDKQGTHQILITRY